MLKKLGIIAGALAIFLVGAYIEAIFRITPAVTALFCTMRILGVDVYSAVIQHRLAVVNTGSLLVAVVGFLILMFFKYLFRAGRSG
ncbi:MAG: hypothetical protein ACYDEQ_13570 [Desulfocucumaceae bacterium]